MKRVRRKKHILLNLFMIITLLSVYIQPIPTNNTYPEMTNMYEPVSIVEEVLVENVSEEVVSNDVIVENDAKMVFDYDMELMSEDHIAQIGEIHQEDILNNDVNVNVSRGNSRTVPEVIDNGIHVIDGKYNLNTSMNSSSGYTVDELKYITESMGNFKDVEDIAHQLYISDLQGVNARFALAISVLESGGGSSSLAINKNNIMGIRAYDSSPYISASTYSTQGECIKDFTDFMLNGSYYMNKGRTSTSEIHTKYASDPNWANKVILIMNNIDSLLGSYR